MKKTHLHLVIITAIILATGSLFAIPLMDKDPDNDPDKKKAKVKVVTIVDGVKTITDTIIEIDDDIDIEVVDLENIEIDIDNIMNEITAELKNISFSINEDEITKEVKINIGAEGGDASFNIDIDEIDEIVEMTLENIDADNKKICKKIIISDELGDENIKVISCDGTEDIDIDLAEIVKKVELSCEQLEEKAKVCAVVIETKTMDLDEDDLKTLEAAGINDNKKPLELENISISPNPSNGNIKLKFASNSDENVKINIYNLNGKKVYSEKIRNFEGTYAKTIDLSSEEKGTYFVNIEQDKKQTTKKIILK